MKRGFLFLTSSLTSLSSYMFSHISDTLPFVWFRFFDGSDKGGVVPNLLLIDSGYVDDIFFFFIYCDSNSFRRRKIHLMRESDSKNELRRSGNFEFISHSLDFERFFVSL